MRPRSTSVPQFAADADVSRLSFKVCEQMGQTDAYSIAAPPASQLGGDCQSSDDGVCAILTIFNIPLTTRFICNSDGIGLIRRCTTGVVAFTWGIGIAIITSFAAAFARSGLVQTGGCCEEER
jgi:hypothetical protein